jgi:hypothetical protein
MPTVPSQREDLTSQESLECMPFSEFTAQQLPYRQKAKSDGVVAMPVYTTRAW